MPVLKKIISHNIFLSALIGGLITFVFILTWDSPITLYEIYTEPFERASAKKYEHWFAGDFNDDGNSERIRCHNGAGAESMDIVHYDNNGLLTGHYHIRGSEWKYELRPAIFDIDGDNRSELVFFTVRNDSVFFNVFSLTEFKLVVDHFFFNAFERKREEYSYDSDFYELGDFDGNGFDELLFEFDAGFGLYPRGVFKIEFPSLKITRSNSEYMVLSPRYLQDINGNGIPEIICDCAAPANTINYRKFSDTISYVTILDGNLNFVFDPVPFPGEYSTIQCIPDLLNDTLLYALFFPRSRNEIPFSVYVINSRGKILRSKSWPGINDLENLSSNLKIINRKPYLLILGVGVFELNSGLSGLPDNLNANMKDNQRFQVAYDLDKDGLDEWISVDNKNQVYIYNEKRNEEVVFESPRPIVKEVSVYQYLKNGKIVKYMLDTGAGFFYFTYQRNPYYFVLYLIYLAVFLIASIFIWLVLYFQKKNIEKKWSTEKQLTELQFNVVKNQLNPHFLFNSLNSVALMINEEKYDDAYDFLSLNARMIQRVMDDASKITRSVQSEIQFTQDFLSIQKRRFKERFNFNIEVSPDADMNFEVPKMCIHTYVENSIKHGFRNMKNGGKLVLKITPLTNGIQILISDNGMGRYEAGKYKDSSGNGIKIMNEFYRLFEKYHGYQIHFSIKDNDSMHKPGQGTVVELKIQKR